MPICQCGEVFKLRRTGPALTSCKACRRAKAREQSRLRMSAMRSRTTGKKHGFSEVPNPIHNPDNEEFSGGSPKLLDSKVEKPDESHEAQDTLSALSTPSDSVRTMDTAKPPVEVGPKPEIEPADTTSSPESSTEIAAR